MSSAPATVLGWMSNAASSSKAWPSYSSSPVQDATSSRASSPTFSDMQRQPYYRMRSHPTSTSERRAQRNRERDPSWVPRPANAFIIFRAEYSRNHAQANRHCAPTPEKTLSKRAAEAWKSLSVQEREPYKQRAEKERQDHAEKHPNYRYKPRRRQSDGPRGATAVSRREQVESLVRRATTRSKSRSSESESASDCTSPSSPASVDYSSPSPEPPATPFRDESPTAPARNGGRSTSMPSRPDAPLQRHLQQSLLMSGCFGTSAHAQLPYEFSDVKPDPLAETPSPYGEPNPFAWQIDPLNSGFNLWQGDQSVGLAQSSPAPAPFQIAADAYTLEGTSMQSQGVVIPSGMRPPMPTQTAGSAYAAATSPLLRRRRAATASGAFPSPLTVVSSSLAHWATPVPTVTVTGASPTAMSSGQATIAPQVYPSPHGTRSWPNDACPPEGAVPVGDTDFDRTPRSSEFPQDVRAPVVPPATEIAVPSFGAVGNAYAAQGMSGHGPAGAYGDIHADFQSYTMGLAELGIEAGAYSMSPFGELDISEFFDFDGDVTTQG